jgi:hypothetical protein
VHVPDALPDALPVAVAVSAARDTAVRRLVEGSLGWQVVTGDAGLPPTVVLCDVGATAATPGVPRLLLVGADDDPVAVASAAREVHACLRWPAPAEVLAGAVGAVVGTTRPRPAVPRVVVGGAAGGVGTTTVALALAGIAAWEGARVLALVRPDAPVPGVPTVGVAALAGPGAAGAAVPVPGVPGLAALATAAPSPADVEVAVPVDLVVVDAGVAGPGVDVLVARPDRVGRAAVAGTTAGAVVLRAGPAGARDLARTHGADPRVLVGPESARVARADARGRVPAGLPGTWLAPLRPLLRGVHRRG